MSALLPKLRPGGRYAPVDCVARHRTAVIIPYRNREQHLRTLLRNLHPILQRQQLDYGIFVIDQVRIWLCVTVLSWPAIVVSAKFFGGFYVLSRSFLDFSVGLGAFVIWLSQILSFYSSQFLWVSDNCLMGTLELKRIGLPCAQVCRSSRLKVLTLLSQWIWPLSRLTANGSS